MLQHQDDDRAAFIERCRAFEERLQADMLNIFCPTHLSLGHEGVAADIHEHIRHEDWLFSTHRNHHHWLAKGGSEQALWDEIHGLESGINGGFAGSQGISDKALRFHASAIVSGLVGVATGTALALKMDGSDAIAVCAVGDAATEQGVFWESLNFAALHRLPILFICENNAMSVDSPLDERQAMPLREKVLAFGVNVVDSVELGFQGARMGIPHFHEAMVHLEADHLNMSTMLPSLGLS